MLFILKIFIFERWTFGTAAGPFPGCLPTLSEGLRFILGFITNFSLLLMHSLEDGSWWFKWVAACHTMQQT